MHRYAIVIALALAAAPTAQAARPATRPQAPAEQPSTKRQVETAIVGAARLIDVADYDGAYERLKPVVGTPAFEELDPEARRLGWYLFGAAAFLSEHYEEAHPALVKSSSLPGATAYDWRLRLSAADAVGDLADVAACVTALSHEFRDTLRAVNLDAVNGFLSAANGRADAAKIKFEVLDALYEVDWAPKGVAMDFDERWRDYATALIERNQPERATRVIASITTVREIIAMRADRRFDPFLRKPGDQFDFRTALEADLAARQARSAAAPTSLSGRVDIAKALSSLDRSAEALAFLDAEIEKGRAAKPVAGRNPVFDDFDDNLIWALNAKANLLFALDRDDEGLAIMINAARRPERGQVNTSQALNLAATYVAMGRPREALEWVAGVESMSGYGRGVMLSNTVCAKVQLNDTAGAAVAMTELRTLKAANPSAVEWGLLCMNDLDGAAAMLIDRLENPETRGLALAGLQTYRRSETPWSFIAEALRRSDLVKARPDVQAVADRVGRIETYVLAP